MATSKEIGRLRSEVRTLKQDVEVAKTKKPGLLATNGLSFYRELYAKDINPFTGMVSGNYWTQTGMPWVSSNGRKAVLTEWFWQPIRGQPRRVDTNELRAYAQDFWVNSCVNTILDEVTTCEWDIVPKEGFEYEDVEMEIAQIKEFLEHPNDNREGFQEVNRACLKDVLEIDAGVIVKVFDIGSYEFDELEPKSGSPLLKDRGQRRMVELYARDGASFLKETDKFGFTKGYWQYSYQIPAHPMWFDREEICYINKNQRSMSPYGYAPMQAVLDIVKSLHFSTIYNRKFFEETTIPDGALSFENTDDLEMQAAKDYWNNELKAQPHKLLMINKKLTFQPFNVTPRELEFLETQKWYYKMVITEFGLTPAELGITDDVNKATGSTQAELNRRKSIRPLLKLLENFWNEHVVSEMSDRVEFQWIVDDPAEKTVRLQNWKLELDMGTKTVNEIRVEEGLEPVAWGDQPQQTLGLVNLAPMDPNSKQVPQQPQTQQSQSNTPEEGANEQSTDQEDAIATDQKRREEAHNEAKRLTMDPYSSASRPVGSFRSASPRMMKYAEKPNFYGVGATTQVDGSVANDLGAYSGQAYMDPTPAVSLDQRKPQNGTAPMYLSEQQYASGTMPDMRCPYCGFSTIVLLTQPDDARQEAEFKCVNCGSTFFAQDIIDAKVLQDMTATMTRTPSEKPETPVTWSPKAATVEMTGTEVDMSVEKYVGYDITKALPVSVQLAGTNEYRKLLQGYFEDLNLKDIMSIIQILKQGLKRDTTIRSIAGQLNNVVGDPVRAENIARTETVRLLNWAQVDQYAKDGVKRGTWIAAPEDGRRCEACGQRDGKDFPLSYLKKNIPLHPRCRCTWG